MKQKQIIPVPLFICLAFTLAMLAAGAWSGRLGFQLSDNSYFASQGRYQLLLLALTLLSLFISRRLYPAQFNSHFRMGELAAKGEALSAFGIKAGDSWLKTGLSLSVVITGVTALFMYFRIRESGFAWAECAANWHWLLLFAALNAFAEESIFRLALVLPWAGKLPTHSICLYSALLFGLPHFAGMPDGLLGASLAGLMGYVLCRSLIETRGLFWAWFIHALQDLVIMASLGMLAVKV